jgi:DNA mismatch repair protein MutS
LIRPGSDQSLDALNEGIREAREWISGLEAREKQRLNISTLKVGYNKVFGYYLETTHQHTHKIPDDYIRKQTLSNGERYITPEMKEYETKILTAESQINDLEYKIFCRLRDEVNTWCPELRNAANALADVDCLYSLAKAAYKRNYHRPEIYDDDRLEIREGFHPVIEAANPDLDFICNDIDMNCAERQLMLITGPNMAGKSTYLRQNGLIVLMAQMGSFVPASHAKIGICDRIFTRVGASDRLARGQSTFMVEMIETANILHNASPRSLILLDEIGRGTSTFDGLSLAWSIVETLHENTERAGKTLFATHYHELTSLASSLERFCNYHITVKEKNGSLLFLRKIVPGACDSSYGIQVAEMAGVPQEVIVRAKKILHRLESHRTDPSDDNFKRSQKPQRDLFEAPDENHILLVNEVSKINPDELTPIQALNFLSSLKKNYL